MKNESLVPEKFNLKVEYLSSDIRIIGDYRFTGNILGKGSYSEVQTVIHMKTGIEYAAKIIEKKKIKNTKFPISISKGEAEKDENLQEALREISILKKMDHDNIIRLTEILHDTEDVIYLILELIPNGPLLHISDDQEVVINKAFMNEEINKQNFSEDELRDISRDIISGLHYIHCHNIVHGDIKPDNILLDSANKCKITDFNFSKLCETDDNFTNDYGNLLFNAPEKCDDEEKEFVHGKPLDVWAFGVTLFMLTYKTFPYDIENFDNKVEILDKISKGEISYPLTRLISEDLEDLFVKVFIVDPEKRITFEEMLDHPWINHKRKSLREVCNKELITISKEELELSLNFFTIRLLKRCASSWIKSHRNSKCSKLDISNLDAK